MRVFSILILFVLVACHKRESSDSSANLDAAPIPVQLARAEAKTLPAFEPVVGTVKPRLEATTVMWGLASLDFSSSYGLANFDTYESALESQDGWLADVDRWTSQHSVLLRERRVLRDPSRLFGAEADVDTENHEFAGNSVGTDGERLLFDPDTSDRLRLVQSARLRDFALDGADIDAILHVGDELAKRDITLILVALPMPQRFVDVHPRTDQDVATVSRALELIAEDLSVTLVGPTRTYDDADFVDFTHLSAAAATRFSTDVAEQLARN